MQKKVVANDILVPEIARLVREGLQVTFVPKGVSMLPFIRGERDSVLLGKPENLEVMDIVLARAGRTYVLHRIISVEGDRITLMGDGNIVGVESCRKDDILAKALRIVKPGSQIDCLGKKHRRRAEIWRFLLPVRRYLLAIYRRMVL